MEGEGGSFRVPPRSGFFWAGGRRILLARLVQLLCASFCTHFVKLYNTDDLSLLHLSLSCCPLYSPVLSCPLLFPVVPPVVRSFQSKKNKFAGRVILVTCKL